MTPDQVYAVAYVAAAAVSLSVGVGAWRRRPAPGSAGLMVLSFAQAAWSTAFAAQWTFTDHGPSLAWLAVRNIGLFVTPVAIVMLTADYTGRRRWSSPQRILLLSLLPALFWLSVPTDPWHGLYLAGAAPAMKIVGGGPLFTINLLYSYALILLGTWFLGTYLVKRPPYPHQAAVLLVALLLPVLHFIAQMAGLDLVPEVNTVPFAFTISGALMWFAFTRLGFLKLVPIARDQLIEQLPVGIVAFDADRRIIDINPAALRMTGASGPVLGRRADDAFPRQLETIYRLREELLTADAAIACAEFAPGLWIEASASVLNDRAGERIATLVILRDITESISAERMQRDFVANVAHELQTPLTGLSLLAEAIPHALQNDPQAVGGFIERLNSEVRRLVRLTDELMTLSAADMLADDSPLGYADVRAVVSEQVAAIDELLGASSQTLEVNAPEGLTVTCDPFELGIMVSNLLHNASRYTEPGGHIELAAELEHDAGDASWVVISVADDGIGIPLEDRERVFERFYRVDKARSRRTGGAGLGLSIVRQFAEKNGGSVSLSSTPGEGSRFTLRLPTQ